MAINRAVVGVKVSRPQVRPYSDVEPAGLFWSHTEQTGDATGGTIQIQVNAPPALIMRLELLQVIFHSVASSPTLSCELDVQWLEDIAGFAGGVGLANRIIVPMREQTDVGGLFLAYGIDHLAANEEMLRRVPIGDMRNVHFNSIVALFLMSVNTNAIVHEFKALFSYWDRDAMTRPGFWDAFYESPAPRIAAL